MKIYISYFYQIRFFKPHQIPLSTALFDPAWYHEGTGNQKHKFKDKNGVWNGLRAEPFMPGATCEGMCAGPDCCEVKDSHSCPFLRRYLIQLNQLNFDEIMTRFERLGYAVQEESKFDEEPEIILIVHEAPDNPCSERWPLIKWFADHGYELKEWSKNLGQN